MAAKVRWKRGAWWVVTHDPALKGGRRKKRVGSTKADMRHAQEIARKVNAKIELGEYAPSPSKKVELQPVPLDDFAARWLRREIELPLDRGHRDHVAHGTARSYRLQVDVHLVPHFGKTDLRQFGRKDVQGFYDHCLDIGRPKSIKSIDMALNVLRLIIGHAVAQGLLEWNAVEAWKRSRPRRRSSSSQRVESEKVLTREELNGVLESTREYFPKYYALMLLLSDTGARFGEAAALRWGDLDLDGATARISRSFSSGVRLGPEIAGGPAGKRASG